MKETPREPSSETIRETPRETGSEQPAPSGLRARLDGLRSGSEPAAAAEAVDWGQDEAIDLHPPGEGTQPGIEHALSDEDREAVLDYTDNGFADLNSELRGGAVSQEIAERAEALSRALAKLPSYEGEVYRGANIPSGIAERYRPGAVVTEAAFTSTSRSQPFEEKNTYWAIQSRSGKDISSLSKYSPEEEVLFDKGSRFRIVDNFTHDGVRYIAMEEVES